MDNSFLYQIARAYAAQSDVDLRRCLFVFPSRRSSLFFQKYLGQCSERPVFSPDIVTIGDLFARLSDLRRGDKIELLYILWTCYASVCRAHGREKVEDFDEFVSLGETILADFNDVDKYMSDHSKLFALIRDLRELDSGYDFLSEEQRDALRRFWGVIVSGKESKEKEKFLGMWAMLDNLYVAFRKALLERGLAYEGMLQREVVENLLHADAGMVSSRLSAYSRIVVVGQNALCKCEMALLDYTRREVDGDFYWDYYGECLRDPANKASFFIKGYMERYPSKYEIEAEAAGVPEIKVVAASSAVAQAKVAAAELAEAGESSTAVVLPDENLLMPLLNSIPENIRKVNVTMGYGLHNSSTASLMDMMASLQMNRRDRGFYHKDVLAILNHPFVRNLAPETVPKLKHDLVKKNLIYAGPEVFASDELLSLIFTPKGDMDGVAAWQMECLEKIAPSLTAIESEFAYGYYTSISHLRDLGIRMGLKTYFRFLREATSRISVDFRGEPLRGLQVMGPLEVRAIDFETLIILSVNEGVFPAKSQGESLIPYNVRRGFGLPTVELFDSIAAYHFYRSIYRAKKVVLVYDSRTKGMLSGEESRFVKQLRYHYRYPIRFESVELEIMPVENAIRSVAKTPEVMARMRELFIEEGEDRKRFSASSLNDYLSCRLKFYYKYVAGLEEEDEISEDLDAGQFGNTFHHTMEAIYKDAGAGSVITKALLGQYITKKDYIESLVHIFLNKEIKQPDDAPLERRNQITANLVAEMVRTTLRRDQDYAPFILVDTEQEVIKEVDITVDGAPSKVLLKGIIDRRDRKETGPHRICDYKTGSVVEVSKYLETSCLDKVFDGEAKTSFQMLLYALLLSLEKECAGSDFLLAVYQIKHLYSRGVESKFCPHDTVEAFAVRLRGLLEEIFNPEVAFDGIDAGDKTCEYCPAKAICGR